MTFQTIHRRPERPFHGAVLPARDMEFEGAHAFHVVASQDGEVFADAVVAADREGLATTRLMAFASFKSGRLVEYDVAQVA